MKKAYRGSCHCGAVRFERGLDLSAGTTRCNCTFCRKARCWMAFAKGDAFRLLLGADVLSDYQHTPRSKPAPFLHFSFAAGAASGRSPRAARFPRSAANFTRSTSPAWTMQRTQNSRRRRSSTPTAAMTTGSPPPPKPATFERGIVESPPRQPQKERNDFDSRSVRRPNVGWLRNELHA